MSYRPQVKGNSAGQLVDLPLDAETIQGKDIFDANDIIKAIYLPTLTSAAIIAALGYTPYDSSNPNGYITGITKTMVITALGYTPYDSSNPNGYITGITKTMVITALGYTPGTSNFSGAYADLTGKPSLAAVATSGSYNDLTNKPTIPVVPTNVSAFTNDAGYLTSHQDISGKLDKIHTGALNIDGALDEALYVAQGTITTGPHSNHSIILNINNIGTPFELLLGDSDEDYIYKRHRTYGQYNWSSWRKIKAGYADTAGSASASDVYSWAKASSKPSYNYSEIGTGNIILTGSQNYINTRSGHDQYDGGMYYSTPGNEALVFANKNSVTSFIFKTGLSCTSLADWTTITPDLQIKNGCVTIGKLIPNGENGAYNLDVNGTAHISDNTYIEGVTTLQSLTFSRSDEIDRYSAGDIWLGSRIATNVGIGIPGTHSCNLKVTGSLTVSAKGIFSNDGDNSVIEAKSTSSNGYANIDIYNTNSSQKWTIGRQGTDGRFYIGYNNGSSWNDAQFQIDTAVNKAYLNGNRIALASEIPSNVSAFTNDSGYLTSAATLLWSGNNTTASGISTSGYKLFLVRYKVYSATQWSIIIPGDTIEVKEMYYISMEGKFQLWKKSIYMSTGSSATISFQSGYYGIEGGSKSSASASSNSAIYSVYGIK